MGIAALGREGVRPGVPCFVKVPILTSVCLQREVWDRSLYSSIPDCNFAINQLEFCIYLSLRKSATHLAD